MVRFNCTPLTEEDKYYDIIESEGVHIIVFGEVGEQWTDEVLSVFDIADEQVYVFSWASVVNLRLQLEVVSYPYIQVWKNGSFIKDMTGYHNETLKQLLMQVNKL